MAQLKSDSAHKSYEMGLHTEQLAGRTQQRFFSAEESDNFTYPQAFEVDFDKTAEIDAAELEGPAVNLRIRELMGGGYGHIVVRNPLAKHSLGVGILNRLKLDFEDDRGLSRAADYDVRSTSVVESLSDCLQTEALPQEPR